MDHHPTGTVAIDEAADKLPLGFPIPKCATLRIFPLFVGSEPITSSLSSGGCVRVLWEAREKKTPSVFEETT